MKKIFSLLLVVIMILSLCACGGSNDVTKSAEDEACEYLKFYIMAQIISDYDGDFEDITYNVKETSKNTFEISGKVTFFDKYDNTFTKKYDATVKYNPDNEECDIIDCVIH